MGTVSKYLHIVIPVFVFAFSFGSMAQPNLQQRKENIQQKTVEVQERAATIRETADPARLEQREERAVELREGAGERYQNIQNAPTDRVEQRQEKAQNLKTGVQERREAFRESTGEGFRQSREHIEEFRANVEARKATIRAEFDERLQGVRGQIAAKWANRKVQLEETRKERIQNIVDRVEGRFQATINRLSALAEKIQNRIDKWTELGVDTSGSQALLDSTELKIADAEAALDAAGATFDAIAGSDNPGQTFEEARVLLEEVKNAIRDAHKALVETVKSLKGLSSVIPPASDESSE